jgi:hypothetical protein
MIVCMRTFFVLLVVGSLFSACAPTVYKVSTRSAEPSIIDNKLIVADGALLPHP